MSSGIASVVVGPLLGISPGEKFPAAHVSPPVILFNTFMGIGYAVLTRWHGTLWAGLIAHILNNALVELLILNGA